MPPESGWPLSPPRTYTPDSAPKEHEIMDRPAREYPAGELRVSDADRDRALSELADAFQSGRITVDELDQRSGQVLRARTGRELAAPLADLPPDRAPTAGTAVVERARHVHSNRISFAGAVAAFCFAAVTAGNALNRGPSRQQFELFREMAARQGLPLPPAMPSGAGVDWAGVITPGAIAVLLVVLVICLRLRLAGTGSARNSNRNPCTGGQPGLRPAGPWPGSAGETLTDDS
jgi:hypothetical protein